MITVSTSGSAVVIIVVAGEINVVDVVALRNEIARVVARGEACEVVLDVSEAHHLGPRGLATLVDEKALLVRRGGDLHLVLRDTPIDQDPEHAGLGRLFRLHGSVEAALASIATVRRVTRSVGTRRIPPAVGA